MIQKCSLLETLKVFFIEPTTIHFIREIGKKIKLAPTSVRKNIKDLVKEKLIIKKKSKPFDGFVADRDNDKFIFYKRVYNLYTLENIKEKLVRKLYPKSIIIFGSYSLGEDVETSDIDVLIISKIKKDIELEKVEKLLKRKINIMIVDNLSRLDKNIQKKVINGIILYGSI